MSLKGKNKHYEDWNVPASYDYAEFDDYNDSYWHEHHDAVDNSETTPQFNKSACSIVMRLLYAFRLARFDVLRICCKLATRFTKWTDEDGRRLLRLMRYIWSTLAHRQIGYIGDDEFLLSVDLYTDADFAGDVVSQRSTSGVHLTIEGPNSNFPLHGISTKQTSQGLSTLEVEIVAACYGYCKVAIPAFDIWEVIGPRMQVPRFHEDNQATIAVITSGRNPTMRHLHRVHRVDIQWLYERLGNHTGRDPTIL